MARGFDAFDAASLSAKMHLECAEIIGPGLIAEDIPEAIPSALKHYLGGKTVST
jgi:NAD(P)H-hydrate repair Nnr-like enzyme with NAD(P)H-hydrate dehydratase domain